MSKTPSSRICPSCHTIHTGKCPTKKTIDLNKFHEETVKKLDNLKTIRKLSKDSKLHFGKQRKKTALKKIYDETTKLLDELQDIRNILNERRTLLSGNLDACEKEIKEQRREWYRKLFERKPRKS